jgi:hypothetical protein
MRRYYTLRSQAQGVVSLDQLSILGLISVGLMAAVIQGWADNSGDDEDPVHKSTVLAGFIAYPDDWKRFHDRWMLGVLGRFELDYVHMKELKGYKGKFARFKDDKLEMIACFQAMISAIKESNLRPLLTGTRLSDLRDFNAKRGRQLNEYSLNLYGCFLQINRFFGDSLVELVLDPTKNLPTKIEAAQVYAASDLRAPKLADTIQPIPLAKALTAKRVPALQAADFLAWEWRRSLHGKDAWFDLRVKADNYQAYRLSQFSFVKAHGERWPYHRQSLGALVNATKPRWMTWTRDSLDRADDARAGAWRVPSRRVGTLRVQPC